VLILLCPFFSVRIQPLIQDFPVEHELSLRFFPPPHLVLPFSPSSSPLLLSSSAGVSTLVQCLRLVLVQVRRNISRDGDSSPWTRTRVPILLDSDSKEVNFQGFRRLKCMYVLYTKRRIKLINCVGVASVMIQFNHWPIRVTQARQLRCETSCNDCSHFTMILIYIS